MSSYPAPPIAPATSSKSFTEHQLSQSLYRARSIAAQSEKERIRAVPSEQRSSPCRKLTNSCESFRCNSARPLPIAGGDCAGDSRPAHADVIAHRATTAANAVSPRLLPTIGWLVRTASSHTAPAHPASSAATTAARTAGCGGTRRRCEEVLLGVRARQRSPLHSARGRHPDAQTNGTGTVGG